MTIIRAGILLLVFVLSLPILFFAPGGIASFVAGEARAETRTEISMYSLESGSLVYRGKETEEIKNGRVTRITTYTTPAGKPIQEKKSVYQIEGLVPELYTMKDLRSGESEELRKDGNNIHMSARENKDEDLDSDSEDWEPGSLISATLVAHMRIVLGRLMNGEEVEFSFYAPSRQESYTFRFVLDEEKTAAENATAKETIVIVMEPGTWLVRRLVDPLYFYLSKKAPHPLLEYRGRTTIRTLEGDTQDLRVTYTTLE